MGQISSGELVLRGRGVWGETVDEVSNCGNLTLYLRGYGTGASLFWCYPQWDHIFDSKYCKRVLVMRTMVSKHYHYWLILRVTDYCGVYERLGLLILKVPESLCGIYGWYENVALEMDITIV
jgi:hypothetical protein